MKNIHFFFLFVFTAASSAVWCQESVDYPYRQMPPVFPGTRELTWSGDLSVRMLDGAHRFIERKIEESVELRQKLWKRDVRSPEAYKRSVIPNRERLKKYLGLGYPDNEPLAEMQKISGFNQTDVVAENSAYRVYYVRWQSLDRIHGEGILLQPKTKPVGHIIAIGDAGHQPEQLAGLYGVEKNISPFAHHLAANGFEVLVPVIISRGYLFAGEEKQQTYREWLYRQSFHMGRHIIGLEIQKVMAAVQWFRKNDPQGRIGVAGYGEGALLAFYAGAVDERIDVVMVSGYFGNRQKNWDEPLYRNVWKLLTEFGDAEIASLIAPRPLLIEHSEAPAVVDRLPAGKETTVGGLPYDGYKGRLSTPGYESVEKEFKRIDQWIKPGFQPRRLIAGEGNHPVPFGSKTALAQFARYMGSGSGLIFEKVATSTIQRVDADKRQLAQMREMEDYIQLLVRNSDQRRKEKFLYKVSPAFAGRKWSTKSYHPYHPVSPVAEKIEPFREYFASEVIGKFEDSLLPPGALTRKIYDNDRWTGYEVVLSVYQDLFTTGILLIPKDIRAGEKRPVVVCQHGRDDTPHKLVEGNATAYNNVAAKLADQGFVVYAPQNPYRGEDRYRLLSRKANLLGKTLFSFIVSQHEQTLRWLSALSFVDPQRIAFYGLSYGGETAMRVPAILKGYCLSICAGDFGDWTRKVTDTHFEGSFMNSFEWEMPYFDMGATFSYAEMAYLIFPRPFMVERGHHDLVQPDEWVLYEYGKVKFFYDQFNLEDRLEMEIFNGGHSMRGEGTFRFLHKHLRWP